MSTKTWRDLLILILIFGAIGAGIFLLKPDPKVLEYDLLNEEREEDLANIYYELIKEEYSFNTNQKVTEPLQALVDSLAQNTLDWEDKEYYLYVLKSDEVNAFTTLNGDLYFFEGLLKELDSAEEFMAVVAHEMGHNANNDMEDQLRYKLQTGVLTSILTGGETAGAYANDLMGLEYSRTQELEADEYARVLLNNSGINPNAFVTALEKIDKATHGISGKVPTMFSTHPHMDFRIKKFKTNMDSTAVYPEKEWLNWEDVLLEL